MQTITKNKQNFTQKLPQPTPVAEPQHPQNPPRSVHSEKQKMLAQMQHKCDQTQGLLYNDLLETIC